MLRALPSHQAREGLPSTLRRSWAQELSLVPSSEQWQAWRCWLWLECTGLVAVEHPPRKRATFSLRTMTPNSRKRRRFTSSYLSLLFPARLSTVPSIRSPSILWGPRVSSQPRLFLLLRSPISRLRRRTNRRLPKFRRMPIKSAVPRTWTTPSSLLSTGRRGAGHTLTLPALRM